MKFLQRIPKIIAVLVPVLALFSASQAFAMPLGFGFFNQSVESIDQTCPPVANTPNFTFAYGAVTLDGVNAPVGALVEAFSPRGDLVGCTLVSMTGKYGAMFVYGEDTSINPPIPGMRSGETVTFTVNGGTAQATPALVWSSDKDLHQVDLSATTPQNSSDLSITKTDSPDPVIAGNNLTYTLTITNNGPSNATGVVLTDSLPSGLTYISATPNQGSCSGTSLVSCQIGNLNNQAGATVTIVASVNPSFRGSITNTASVSGSQTDPNTVNNSSTSTTTVNGSADLSINKLDNPDPVIAGNNLTYTIGVSNSGPSTATGVTVTDTLPSGTTYGSANPSQGTCSGSAAISCTLGSLNPQASATITITVTVNPDTRGSISNTASVSGSENDPNTGNNSASASTSVNASTDLSIVKDDSPDPVVAGSNLTYTLTVTNNGPSMANGVSVFDTLPSGATFISSTPSQGTCSGTNAITCSIGAVSPQTIVTVTLVVKVNPDSRGSLSNTTTVSGNETDPNPGNNSSITPTTINTLADLAVTKTDNLDPVNAGNDLTYTIGVTNNGPSQATGVSLSDSLPSGVTYVSAAPSQGTCSGTTTVTCSLGILNPQASATITLIVMVNPDARGTLSNTATVTGNETDPTPGNNSSTADTTINASIDLSISKIGDPDPVWVSQNLTYTVTITNNGPSTATGVIVDDNLPADVLFISANPSQGNCTGSTNLSCNLGILAPQATTTIVITVKVKPNAPDSFYATASVTANELDSNLNNNNASSTTTVRRYRLYLPVIKK